MTKVFSSRWVLAAAVAAVPLLGLNSRADAQYRINQDGRALDANNRLGSDGRNPNDSGARVGDVTGNNIVTGNVTAGKHFRGAVPYTDPNAFRGRTAGIQLDNFVRQSSGPDGRLAESVEPFYGAGRGVAPPAGFTQVSPGTGGFVPIGTTVHRPIGDQRLGSVDLTQTPMALPSPGELLLPGPVDPTAGQQYITASPLTGIRQVSGADLDLNSGLTHTQYSPVTNRIDAQQIDMMRNELNEAAGQGGAAPREGADGAGATGTTGTGATNTGNTGATPLAGAREVQQKPIAQQVGPGAVAIAQNPVETAINQSPNNTNTNQGVRQRLVVPPEAQSTLYADLLRRHQQSASDQTVSDADAARDYNAAVRARDQAKAAGGPGAPGALSGQPGAAPGQPGALPGQPGAAPGQPGAGPGGIALAPPGGATPGAAPGTAATPPGEATVAPGVPDYAARNQELLKSGRPDEKKRVQKAEPVKVPSLGQGVKGKGLAELMNSAEQLMKDGKFTSALDQYDQAEQVAPNNPLIRLGRANAELGASYYARAETHLREVFTKNPELLVGQYDLTGWLGEQRLQVLVNDLKEIAGREKTEARPLFLLAYIAYNTGHEQNAEAYLDLADKRSGGNDPFYKILRENWALPEKSAPATTPAADQNK